MQAQQRLVMQRTNPGLAHGSKVVVVPRAATVQATLQELKRQRAVHNITNLRHDIFEQLQVHINVSLEENLYTHGSLKQPPAKSNQCINETSLCA